MPGPFALLARQLEREQDRVERAERRLEEERRLLDAERRCSEALREALADARAAESGLLPMPLPHYERRSTIAAAGTAQTQSNLGFSGGCAPRARARCDGT
jgi:hypothetical protein